MKDKSIYESINLIKSRKDFIDFLYALTESFEKNKGEWHNDTLESFLEGLYGYNFGQEESDKIASWSLFAEMLVAAKVYE